MSKTKNIYYAWADHKNFKYLINKYPVVNEQNITGIKTYVVDQYLVVGEHHSTRYIESYYLDSDIRLSNDRIGHMSLDYKSALEWLKDEKHLKELQLTDALNKLKSSEIEDCGE